MLVGPGPVRAPGPLEVPRELLCGAGRSPRESQSMGRWREPDEDPRRRTHPHGTGGRSAADNGPRTGATIQRRYLLDFSSLWILAGSCRQSKTRYTTTTPSESTL